MADTRPLVEKLRQSDAHKLTLALAQQPLEDYFFAFSDMLGDGRFDDIYNNQIAPRTEDEHDLLCQFLHQLPRTRDRTDLLYLVLIEPFLAMRGPDKEDDTEDENDDAPNDY